MRTFHKLLIALPMLLASLAPACAGPALLFEADSGKVLYSEDVDDSWYPASLTTIF